MNNKENSNKKPKNSKFDYLSRTKKLKKNSQRSETKLENKSKNKSEFEKDDRDSTKNELKTKNKFTDLKNYRRDLNDSKKLIIVRQNKNKNNLDKIPRQTAGCGLRGKHSDTCFRPPPWATSPPPSSIYHVRPTPNPFNPPWTTAPKSSVCEIPPQRRPSCQNVMSNTAVLTPVPIPTRTNILPGSCASACSCFAPKRSKIITKVSEHSVSPAGEVNKVLITEISKHSMRPSSLSVNISKPSMLSRVHSSQLSCGFQPVPSLWNLSNIVPPDDISWTCSTYSLAPKSVLRTPAGRENHENTGKFSKPHRNSKNTSEKRNFTKPGSSISSKNLKMTTIKERKTGGCDKLNIPLSFGPYIFIRDQKSHHKNSNENNNHKSKLNEKNNKKIKTLYKANSISFSNTVIKTLSGRKKNSENNFSSDYSYSQSEPEKEHRYKDEKVKNSNKKSETKLALNSYSSKESENLNRSESYLSSNSIYSEVSYDSISIGHELKKINNEISGKIEKFNSLISKQSFEKCSDMKNNKRNDIKKPTKFKKKINQNSNSVNYDSDSDYANTSIPKRSSTFEQTTNVESQLTTNTSRILREIIDLAEVRRNLSDDNLEESHTSSTRLSSKKNTRPSSRDFRDSNRKLNYSYNKDQNMKRTSTANKYSETRNVGNSNNANNLNQTQSQKTGTSVKVLERKVLPSLNVSARINIPQKGRENTVMRAITSVANFNQVLPKSSDASENSSQLSRITKNFVSKPLKLRTSRITQNKKQLYSSSESERTESAVTKSNTKEKQSKPQRRKISSLKTEEDEKKAVKGRCSNAQNLKSVASNSVPVGHSGNNSGHFKNKSDKTSTVKSRLTAGQPLKNEKSSSHRQKPSVLNVMPVGYPSMNSWCLDNKIIKSQLSARRQPKKTKSIHSDHRHQGGSESKNKVSHSKINNNSHNNKSLNRTVFYAEEDSLSNSLISGLEIESCDEANVINKSPHTFKGASISMYVPSEFALVNTNSSEQLHLSNNPEKVDRHNTNFENLGKEAKLRKIFRHKPYEFKKNMEHQRGGSNAMNNNPFYSRMNNISRPRSLSHSSTGRRFRQPVYSAQSIAQRRSSINFPSYWSFANYNQSNASLNSNMYPIQNQNSSLSYGRQANNFRISQPQNNFLNSLPQIVPPNQPIKILHRTNLRHIASSGVDSHLLNAIENDNSNATLISIIPSEIDSVPHLAVSIDFLAEAVQEEDSSSSDMEYSDPYNGSQRRSFSNFDTHSLNFSAVPSQTSFF